MWLLVRIESAPVCHRTREPFASGAASPQAIILFQGNYVDVMITIG